MSTDVWDDWQDQAVTVRPLLGSGGMGDIYGPPVVVPVLLDESTRLVRDASAAEVVSSATLYADRDVVAPPGSTVTLPDGSVRTVITTFVHHADDADLAGVEVALT